MNVRVAAYLLSISWVGMLIALVLIGIILLGLIMWTLMLLGDWGGTLVHRVGMRLHLAVAFVRLSIFVCG